MSVRWWDWGSKHGPPESRDRHVWLALANHADDGGACYPSLPFLVKETCKSESTVRRALNALEAGGWIIRTQRGNGRGNRAHYQLVKRASAGDPLTDKVATKKGCQADSQRVSGGRGKGVTVTEPPHPLKGVTVREPSERTVIEKHTPISPSRGEQEADSERKGNGPAKVNLGRIAFTAAVNAVHDALMRLTPPAFEKRRNFRNGAEEWNEYRFGDLAFESLEDSGADGLVLKVSSPDPDATARGLEKYKNRWDKALLKEFGKPVRLAIRASTQDTDLPCKAQDSSDVGEVDWFAQIAQSVLSDRASRAADLIEPQPEPTRNALTAPTSPLSPEDSSRTGEAPPIEPPREQAADLSAQTGEDIPEGLSVIEYATRVLEEQNMQAPSKLLLGETERALRELAELEKCTEVAAARRMRGRMAARARTGSPRWYEWMKTGGWKESQESHLERSP